MAIFIGFLKVALIVVLLGLMLGGGVCVVAGLQSLRYSDAYLIAGIGLTTLVVSGWLAWLLVRSFFKQSSPPSEPTDTP